MRRKRIRFLTDETKLRTDEFEKKKKKKKKQRKRETRVPSVLRRGEEKILRELINSPGPK